MGQLVCLALRFALFLELFLGRETPHLNRQSNYPRSRIERRLGRFFQPARKPTECDASCDFCVFWQSPTISQVVVKPLTK
jgi:hypothetical protein